MAILDLIREELNDLHAYEEDMRSIDYSRLVDDESLRNLEQGGEVAEMEYDKLREMVEIEIVKDLYPKQRQELLNELLETCPIKPRREEIYKKLAAIRKSALADGIDHE